MNEPSFHPTAGSVIEDLRRRFPHTPFLALGQTVLWDEPTKAAFRRALDHFWPEAPLVAAVHDSDYFAKLPGHPASAGEAKYALAPHDDATTRGLWSAAGEMSCLFGSEDVPTRAKLEKAGVSLERALYGLDDPTGFLSEVTAAWGWTGIIHTESGRRIAHDIPLRDILPTLLEQIEWATESSMGCIEGEGADAARAVAGAIRGWVQTFAESHPRASLSDLYRDLFPRFYELLLGAPPANLSTSNTLRLLRFNRASAHLPRFAFADLFLRPETRKEAIEAYNRTVAGTEMYTLDRFGDGALPFDLVIPGRGRGTLCVHGDARVTVATEKPLTLCATCDVSSIEKLADLVERELGPDVALVGKAISLISMLASEFVLVFHEGASGYTHRTRQMHRRLGAAGVPLPELRPILRVRYHTWDALAALGDGAAFRLPEHLAQAFSRDTVGAAEFAACWQCACRHEKQRMETLSQTRSPRALLGYLARVTDDGWEARARDYEAARMRLLAVWDRAQAIQGRVYTLYDQVKQLKSEVASLERAKGDDFRARVRPLRERLWRLTRHSDAGPEIEALQKQIDALQAERAGRFDREIQERRSQIRFALATVRDLKAGRLALERGPQAAEARETLRRIEAQAERAKARLARNALRVLEGLPHTNFRPSAWWFPLVDPSRAWFRRLSDTAEYHLEDLTAAAEA